MNWLASMLSPSRSSNDSGPSPLAGNAAAISGGDMREDGRVSFGFSLMRGRRPNMEDFYTAEVRMACTAASDDDLCLTTLAKLTLHVHVPCMRSVQAGCTHRRGGWHVCGL